ncbi:MAG: D-alanyl-D-alanine carboxypeptidase [Deltaproteobacteria bacterium]|nr:D-alanyl-D-alanine carboxypeptidase [Deltaproteobacteria bacterium]
MSGPLLKPPSKIGCAFARYGRKTLRAIGLGMALTGVFLVQPPFAGSKQSLPCLANITATDAFLIADPRGRILHRKNEKKKFIPASTLKVLTALAALEQLGPSYRFRTEFYTDVFHNLKVKGYGDPLLVSEVLEELAHVLSSKIHRCRSVILDGSYFSTEIAIPGCNGTTNPYDAPVGAICANFNTVGFQRDRNGKIVSSEKQTPLIPFARDRIRSLGLKPGRHTFLYDSQSAACYAGELLLHFLREKGVACDGSVRSGRVGPDDLLVYTYESVFPLETVVQKMLKSSSNFMANELFLVLGAATYGPPASLTKGIEAVTDFAGTKIGLQNMKIVEGSGISRQNRLSALDMLAVLKRFKPYRRLLTEKDQVYYKTGSLRGIRTRVGYVDDGLGEYYYFVIFFNRPHDKMNAMLDCVKKTVARQR